MLFPFSDLSGGDGVDPDPVPVNELSVVVVVVVGGGVISWYVCGGCDAMDDVLKPDVMYG